jgi:hypothetical protein
VLTSPAVAVLEFSSHLHPSSPANVHAGIFRTLCCGPGRIGCTGFTGKKKAEGDTKGDGVLLPGSCIFQDSVCLPLSSAQPEDRAT